jgi:hypothetical protein
MPVHGVTGYHDGLFHLVRTLGADLMACFIEASFQNGWGNSRPSPAPDPRA